MIVGLNFKEYILALAMIVIEILFGLSLIIENNQVKILQFKSRTKFIFTILYGGEKGTLGEDKCRSAYAGLYEEHVEDFISLRMLADVANYSPWYWQEFLRSLPKDPI